MTHRDEPHYVYRILGRRGRVLYIGCTMNVARRMTEHRQNLRMRGLIGSVTVSEPMDFDTARAMERELIETQRPAFNVEHTPRHRRGISIARRAA